MSLIMHTTEYGDGWDYLRSKLNRSPPQNILHHMTPTIMSRCHPRSHRLNNYKERLPPFLDAQQRSTTSRPWVTELSRHPPLQSQTAPPGLKLQCHLHWSESQRAHTGSPKHFAQHHGFTSESSWFLLLTPVHFAMADFVTCAIDHQVHGFFNGLAAHIPDINPVVNCLNDLFAAGILTTANTNVSL